MTANVTSSKVKGNLVYTDQGAHSKRWVDAIGPDVIKVIKDFTEGPGVDAAFDNEYTVTRVEAGAGESTITRIDGSGGFARITTDANEDDGINLQLLAESFKFKTSNFLYFGAFGIKISDATQSDFFLGLAVTDTDILGGVTDRVGFESLDGGVLLKAMLEKNTTETLTASLANLANDTAFDLEFFWDGPAAKIKFFLNGAAVATPAITNLVDDEDLRFTWQFLAGAAAVKTMDMDKFVVIQVGR